MAPDLSIAARIFQEHLGGGLVDYCKPSAQFVPGRPGQAAPPQKLRNHDFPPHPFRGRAKQRPNCLALRSRPVRRTMACGRPVSEARWGSSLLFPWRLIPALGPARGIFQQENPDLKLFFALQSFLSAKPLIHRGQRAGPDVKTTRTRAWLTSQTAQCDASHAVTPPRVITMQPHLLKPSWWSCFEACGYSHLTSSL
jgi:hypothetical protein